MFLACSLPSFLNFSGWKSVHVAKSKALFWKLDFNVSLRLWSGLLMMSSSAVPAKLPNSIAAEVVLACKRFVRNDKGWCP